MRDQFNSAVPPVPAKVAGRQARQVFGRDSSTGKMKFEETSLRGAYLITTRRSSDERGAFTRVWGRGELEQHGLNPSLAQASMSFNHAAGTLRGMHFQVSPYREAKLIRCIRGAIYDVIIDLRRDSPTFKCWYGAELTEANNRALYAPEGFAHGYMTLADDSEVLYFISEFYQPEFQAGFRFDDPAVGIQWPRQVAVISDRDLAWPSLDSQT